MLVLEIYKLVSDTVYSAVIIPPNVQIITPDLLSEELLRKTHSSEYISKIQEISDTGVGDIDIDTPGFKNIYFHSRIASGASVTGVNSVMSGAVDHFISPSGMCLRIWDSQQVFLLRILTGTVLPISSVPLLP